MEWLDECAVQVFICCCTILAALLEFEAFISKGFPFQRHLTGFWSNNVFLGAKRRRGWKERGPLLLFNSLCFYVAPTYSEAQFVDVIGTKVLLVFVLAIHSNGFTPPPPPHTHTQNKEPALKGRGALHYSTWRKLIFQFSSEMVKTIHTSSDDANEEELK